MLKNMSENIPPLEGIKVAELAIKLRKYFDTVYGAHIFLAIGTVIASYWMIIFATATVFNLFESLTFWLGALILMWILIPFSIRLVPYPSPIKTASFVKKLSTWVLPFIILYTASISLILSKDPLLTDMGKTLNMGGAGWYLAVTLGLLLNHFVWEKQAYNKGQILAKPYVISGVFMLATSPAVYYFGHLDIGAGNILAVGLMLLGYGIAAFISIRKAYRWLQGA
jgi:hypothetical protein